MLESLHIANYALIDCIDIDFHSGLNIITGETGAGKSIMLGALSLILGGRADTKAVRQADRKSVIEASFKASAHPKLQELCEANDIDWDPTTAFSGVRSVLPVGHVRLSTILLCRLASWLRWLSVLSISTPSIRINSSLNRLSRWRLSTP